MISKKILKTASMGVVPLIVLVGTIFMLNFLTSSDTVCPDDFKPEDVEKKAAVLEKWLDTFSAENPEATMQEAFEAREKFYIENNCIGALKRLDDYDYIQSCEPSSIPSVGISESYSEYSKTFTTYTDELGFSFQYPPHMEILAGGRIANFISVTSPESDENNRRDIIVSIGLNDENMTPEEWLFGPDSGYPQSQDQYGKCYKTIIGGQEAVYTDGGMWTVVNTPDNKYRLSIADLTTGTASPPFTEIGIVVESLNFGD